MKSTKTTVTSSATLLKAASGDLGYPQAVLIKNPTGGNTVYLGGADVTTVNGFPLAATEAVSLDVAAEAVYAICATSQDVNVLSRSVA